MKHKHRQYYMSVARQTAQLSYCKRLQVGSIIVKDNRIISIGYNGTFSGDKNCCEDEHGKTLDTVIHAEENAIMKVAQSNDSTHGASIFVTHQPCINCARLIANCGITSVFYEHDYKCSKGTDLLTMRGISVYQLDQRNIKRET